MMIAMNSSKVTLSGSERKPVGTRVGDQPNDEMIGISVILKPKARAVAPRSGGATVSREQFAANQHAANFTGACTDLIQLRIAPQTPDRILVDVAIATQDLDRFASHPRRFFGRVKNHARAILADLAAMTGA